MSGAELLGRLHGLGVRVWRDGAELRLSAPRGVLSDALKAELAARKPELLAALADAALGPAAFEGRAGAAPLSSAQERLWFLQRLDPGLVAYNVPMAWTVRGALDPDALERALLAIVERHAVLRTVYPLEDARPRQRVLPAAQAFRLERWTEDGALAGEAWRDAVRERLEALAREPFDLARGPLLRPVLARLAPERHVLFACVHHVAFDGTSIDLFLRELQTELACAAAGRPSGISPPPVSYAAYARWQAERLRGPDVARQLAWWRSTLAGELAPLELPCDRPRPAVQTHAGARCSAPLPGALVEALERLARAEGATLFMGLLAAYQALLARVCARSDVVVATPVAGRHVEGVEGLLGCFAGTLVLRVQVDMEEGFRALLARARDACLGAFEHQDVPFERLVDALAPERSLGHTPLFQTMFLVEEARGAGAGGEGLVFEPYELATRVARTDLVLYPYRADGAWSVWAEYATDLFEAPTIERLLASYVRLLAGALADPERPLGALELLAPAERAALVSGWQRGGEAFPERAIHELVHETAARAPDALAVLVPALAAGAADERLSYGELARRAHRLAHHLVARGLRPGALVGLCLERSSELVVAMLAILEAGAAYVPLDPAWPATRLVAMAEDAGLALVVTSAEHEPLFAPLLARGALATCLPGREAASIAARPDAPLGLRVDARERMYAIYTSGSTGRPKGVQIEHRSVSNLLASILREPGLAPGELLLALTTPSFDISVLELFAPLVCGATVAIAPARAALDAAALAALLARLRPDVLQATPATWRLLLLAGWPGDRERLRAFSGGEALPRELADLLLARTKELWNLYGPTETTIWSTAARVRPGAGPVPIGRPLANTRTYVLDERLEPVPLGARGELWIAGAGLARGYLGRPELDRERFVPDPLAPGERMYRTGDLARWRLAPGERAVRPEAPGELECLGRIDAQVKLRGHRIEPGEVEAVLGAHEGVAACAAVVRDEGPLDRRLVLCWTRRPGASVDADLLRALARERLPAPLVPSLFEERDALPLTSGGKLDRRALAAARPAPRPAAARAPGDEPAPRDATEAAIARAWGEALGLERVPLEESFFDLGGHSLLLAQVHARLLERFPGLQVLELFQHPTVAALAAHLRAAAPRAAAGRGARAAAASSGGAPR